MSRKSIQRTARRDWGSDDSGCDILHLDMDSFFASVEVVDNPALKDLPVIVGGLGNHGVVSASSYEARVFGVHSAMPIVKARQLCPQGVFLPVRMSRYSEVSKRVMGMIAQVSPHIEQLSVDEAFVDIKGARLVQGSALEISASLRARIREELGLPASVGIAATKSVAKLASTHAKPDGVMLIPVSQTQNFLNTLPVGALWGVGESTQKTLGSYGISTVKQLVNFAEADVVRMLGRSAGSRLFALARGIDPREVETQRQEKSLSTETTFSSFVHSRQELHRVALEQAHQCAHRLRASAMVAATISIKLRSGDFSTVTRAKTLGTSTDVARVIAATACDLIDSVEMPTSGVRLLGVRVSALSSPSEGVQMFVDDDGRQALAERAMDGVQQRFGANALLPASLVSRREELAEDASRRR